MAKGNKVDKKVFFEVRAPLTSTKISLYAPSQESLVGKIITLDLTRSLRGKSIILKLKVILEEGILIAEPVSIELVGSYIRKMFRGGIDYVEDSFITDCKDVKVIVKPFMLTRKKVSREVRKKLRDASREHLLALLKMRTSREIFTDLLSNKLQKELSLKLKKIYPLGLCEIRIFKILEPEKGPQAVSA